MAGCRSRRCFRYVDLPVERPFTPVNASAPIEPDVRETTRTFDGRIYILLMDDLHTTVTRTALVRDTASKFIERYLGANDLAAVVYTSARQEAGQELTSNRKLLIDAVNRFQGHEAAVDGAGEACRASDPRVEQPDRRRRRRQLGAGPDHRRAAEGASRIARPARRRACLQRAALAAGARERRQLAGRRAGAAQGAALLQRGARLRHLPAVQPRARRQHDHPGGAGRDGRRAARQRQHLRRRPARPEPVRRD